MDKNSSLRNKLRKSLGRDFPKAIRKNRRLIASVATIFFILVGIAVLANQIGDNPVNRAIKNQTEPSRRTLRKEARAERSALGWTGFYLRNNLVNVVEIVGLGVVFGVFPLYALVMNGFLIGYVGSAAHFSALGTLSILLPHGVFELTGYILAISCGVRLGIGSFRSVLEREVEPLREAGRSIAGLVPVVILLLIIAGFIEGFISSYRGPVLDPLKIGASLVSLAIILLWMSGKITRSGGR